VFGHFLFPPSVWHDTSGTTLAINRAQSQRATACWAINRRCSLYAIEIDKELQMLVLSRKVGERIHVGDNIVLEIRRIAGNRVTLALDAPRDVRILRGELEHAANEFRQPDHSQTAAAPYENGSVAKVTILQSLPADTVGRHCVS
jgi:carbon storage regulator